MREQVVVVIHRGRNPMLMRALPGGAKRRQVFRGPCRQTEQVRHDRRELEGKGAPLGA
jgi:hypothetical protein